MAANKKFLLEVEPEIAEKAQLDANAQGQTVEDVLSAWIKRGASTQSAWDGPIEAPEAAAFLMKMIEDNKARNAPK